MERTPYFETDNQAIGALRREVAQQRDCLRALMQVLMQDGVLSDKSAVLLQQLCPDVAIRVM